MSIKPACAFCIPCVLLSVDLGTSTCRLLLLKTQSSCNFSEKTDRRMAHRSIVADTRDARMQPDQMQMYQIELSAEDHSVENASLISTDVTKIIVGPSILIGVSKALVLC